MTQGIYRNYENYLQHIICGILQMDPSLNSHAGAQASPPTVIATPGRTCVSTSKLRWPSEVGCGEAGHRPHIRMLEGLPEMSKAKRTIAPVEESGFSKIVQLIAAARQTALRTINTALIERFIGKSAKYCPQTAGNARLCHERSSYTRPTTASH